MQNFDKIKGMFNRAFPKAKIDKTDIPLFAVRQPEDERLEDKYEKNFLFQDLYAGVFAYGYQTMHTGGCESLYRTISSIVLSNLERRESLFFLDLGCGTGRTLYDLAELYPKSAFTGLDYSYNMIIRANEILLENTKPTEPEGQAIRFNETFKKNLSDRGFKSDLQIKKKRISNVNLIQGSATDIPFKEESFHCLTNTFLIDRTKGEVEKNIRESVRVLKKGGLFILTDPMNFESPGDWSKFRSKDAVIEVIKKSGIDIQEYFDDLIYRELSDAYGNYRDWRALVVWGFKK